MNSEKIVKDASSQALTKDSKQDPREYRDAVVKNTELLLDTGRSWCEQLLDRAEAH